MEGGFEDESWSDIFSRIYESSPRWGTYHSRYEGSDRDEDSCEDEDFCEDEDSYWDIDSARVDYLNAYIKAKSPVTSTIEPLDAILKGGFRPGLHVIGGNTGAGKTALALYMAARIASRKDPDTGDNYGVVFYSMELGLLEVRSRIGSMLSYVMDDLDTFSWSKIEEMAAAERNRVGGPWPFEDPVCRADMKLVKLCPRLKNIDATTSSGMAYIDCVEGMLQSASRNGASIVFIDYLQCIETMMKDDEQTALRSITRKLNQLGIRCGVAVVVLSAVSRGSGSAMRSGTAPTTDIFRGSSWIEYTGLTCMALVRLNDAEMCGGTVAEQISVVKNRRGACGDVDIGYQGAYGNFNFMKDAITLSGQKGSECV